MFGLIGSDEFNLHANNGPVIINTSIALMVLSGVAVFLRFVARKTVKQPLLWDDWMILLGLLFSWSICIGQIVAVIIGGFGQHVQLATLETATRFFQMLYFVQIVYIFAIAFIKWSILLFYRRIFSVSGTKVPLLVIGVIVLCWSIASILASILSCVPVAGFWDKASPSKCINTTRFFLGVAIPNITTDLVILIFPLPMIWKLRMAKSQKVALMGVFTLGGFVVIISSLRLVTVIEVQNDLDFTCRFTPLQPPSFLIKKLGSLIPLAVFNMVETSVGTILACLPSMTPLLRLALGQRLATSTSRKGPSTSNSSHFARLNDLHANPATMYGADVEIVKTGANSDHVELLDAIDFQKGIQVKSKIQWESHARH
ncbi:MAG: hypothetical protein MMC33_002527 [Icmadophila ericetorum]|nr:hypothetical protein [Icmadophila ericetorum]